MRLNRTLALGASLLVLVSACTTGGGGPTDVASAPTPSPTAPPTPITIGSAGFYEAQLMGEIYAQALEANGYEIRRQLGIGPRDNTQAAITSGQVDLLPEYIGSLLAFLGREAGGEGDEQYQATGDSAQTYERLQAALEEEGLTVLEFTPAQDHNAFVVRPDTAERYGLETMTDLAAVATELVWGLPPECDGNPLCRGALEDVYGIPWDELRIEPLAPCDAPMAIALNEGAIDVAELCSTQPDIERFDFVVLDDDQLTQPAENIAPVVRKELLETLPSDFTALLNSVSAPMTTEELTSLGVRVAVDQESIEDVARSWLEGHGLLD